MKKFFIIIQFLIYGLISHAQLLHEYINFETRDSLLTIDTTLTGNTWQIGTPSKIFFDSAWSAPKAIVTDTLNFYPPNNFSAFTIKIWDPSWNLYFYPIIAFNIHHKFDTDSLKDGGYIEVSYDSGSTWENLASAGLNYNWGSLGNPIIADGNEAYTGKSSSFFAGDNGWRNDFFNWCPFIPWPSPPAYLRFVFSSDSIQTNKEGWMIDDIEIYLDICEGIHEIQNENLITVYPNPASDKLFVQRNNPGDKQQIEIFNYTGKVYYNRSDFTDTTIDIREFPNGLYLLKYSSNKQFAVKRFVIQH
jgi:hypothetical protein